MNKLLIFSLLIFGFLDAMEKEIEVVHTSDNGDGETVLEFLKDNDPNMLIVRYDPLLSRRKDWHRRNEHFDLCTTTLMFQPTIDNQVPILKLIELCGGDVEILQDWDQMTLLQVATYYGSIEAMEFFIQHNVHVGAVDLAGYTIDQDFVEGMRKYEFERCHAPKQEERKEAAKKHEEQKKMKKLCDMSARLLLSKKE